MTTSLDFAKVTSFSSHICSRRCSRAGGSARSITPLPILVAPAFVTDSLYLIPSILLEEVTRSFGIKMHKHLGIYGAEHFPF